MEQLLKFNLELKKINFLNISVIKDFNSSISERFEKLFKIYNLTSNKFYILQELVNLGFLLENLPNNKIDFMSEQLSTFSNLFNPIIFKIKEISFELNNQIVNDLKLTYDNAIESELTYKDDIKIYKSIQFSSNVKSYYNNKHREIPFDEFGVSVKIPNSNDKYLFKNIIDSLNVFSVPILILSRKYDWIWKAQGTSIHESLEYLNWVCDVNIKQIENIVEENIETINEQVFVEKLSGSNNGDQDEPNKQNELNVDNQLNVNNELNEDNKPNESDNIDKTDQPDQPDQIPSIVLIKNILKQYNSGHNYDFMKKEVGENLIETTIFFPHQNNSKQNTNTNQTIKLSDMTIIEDDSFNLQICSNNIEQKSTINFNPIENLNQIQPDEQNEQNEQNLTKPDDEQNQKNIIE